MCVPMSKNSWGIETARKVNFLTLKVITQYPMDFCFLGVRLKVDIRLWISDGEHYRFVNIVADTLRVWVSLFFVMPYKMAPYRAVSKWFISSQTLES